MQPLKTVLVVVPGDELRRSIEFTLRAEGLGVESHGGFGSFFAAANIAGFSCAIVDEDAIEDGEENLARLVELAGASRPIVVLLDRMTLSPGSLLFRTLPKPLLGPALIEAISTNAVESAAIGGAT